MACRPLVLLAQLPIPPPGPLPVRGNVPLAAAYLKLFARRRGLEERFDIEILPPALTNSLGDRGLVEAVLARGPAVVGFTCYLWNIDRTLWLASQLKARRPEVVVVLGGPEITADNAWVLEHPAVDYAVVGEGEQTFAELLAALRTRKGDGAIAGLWDRARPATPAFRAPLANLDDISTVYLDGILDAAEERMMLLETVRGCVFKCKFCYYPKSFDALYFLARERIAANLAYARSRGVREVFLLDPTLNQRRDFADFLRLLAEGNPERQFTYSGELRAEGIKPEHARLMRRANFAEVELGLQSLDPHAQRLMDRTVNLKAFERGVRAMMDEGIRVRVDLIVGLPGDTPDSVRRGIDYLARGGLYSEMQVFSLSVLPGTAFRHEAAELGLVWQPRPPYYALRTPTLSLEDLCGLMAEAQEAFGIEFDPLPPPSWEVLRHGQGTSAQWRIDLDAPAAGKGDKSNLCEAGHQAELGPGPLRGKLDLSPFPAAPPHLVQTLWLQSADFHARRHEAAAWVRRLLDANPHTTLQVVLEPMAGPERLTVQTLSLVLEACYRTTSYLDRFYSLSPGRLLGAKRIVVLLSAEWRDRIGPGWIAEAADFAAIAWHGADVNEADLMEHEWSLGPSSPTNSSLV